MYAVRLVHLNRLGKNHICKRELGEVHFHQKAAMRCQFSELVNEMLGNKMLVTSIETSCLCCAVFSLFLFALVVLFMRKQWCSVWHLDATIKAAIRVR